jgi:hypothetical protein
MSTVLNSPIVAEMTGSSARNPPVNTKFGFVGEGAALEVLISTLTAVPTRAASVA